MAAHPSPSDDLNELEQRLSEWRPAAAGLDADRMLFAAGQRSARRGLGRIVWPIVCGCLAIVVATLGVRLGHERSARLELAAILEARQPVTVPVPPSRPAPDEPPAPEPPAPHSYLATRQALAHDTDPWRVVAKHDAPPAPSPLSRPILTSGWRGELFEP